MSHRRRDLLVALLLASLAFAAHARALTADLLHFDDHLYVWENPAVMAGLTPDGLVFAFTNHSTQTNWHAPNWVPLAFISHMIDAQVYGQRAWGHHLTNLLLHAANAALLFLLLKKLTRAPWRSAIAAAFFAVHPIHIESVAWVAERRDVLSMFFGLLALLAYCRYALRGHRPARSAYWVCWLCMGLAVMSKPMMVTLPCVMLLLDYWPLARLNLDTAPRLVLEKLPLAVWSLLSAVLTYKTQYDVDAIGKYPLAWRIQSAVVGLAHYLQLLFWPADLSAYYPFQSVYTPQHVAGALIVLCLITAVALLLWRSAPYLLVGWLWYVGTMVPVIGLIQVGGQAIACRYAYLPFIGLYIMLVWSAYDLARVRPARFAAAGVAFLLLVPLSISTWIQTAPWLTTVSLMRQAVHVSPASGMAWFNYADALGYAGRTADAASAYAAAARLEPANAVFQAQLGSVLLAQGKVAPAEARARAAIHLNQKLPLAFSVLGQCLLAQEDLNTAGTFLAMAKSLDPNDPSILFNLGVVRAQQDNMKDAADLFAQSVHHNSRDPKAWYYLARCLASLRQFDPAIDAYQHALRLNPNWSEARDGLGESLADTAHFTDAVAQFRLALKLDPSNTDAAQHLASALAYLKTHPPHAPSP